MKGNFFLKNKKKISEAEIFIYNQLASNLATNQLVKLMKNKKLKKLFIRTFFLF